MYQKITHGFVTQTFSADHKPLSQEFTAGDIVEYEKDGEVIDPPPIQEENYLPFHMKQPITWGDSHWDEHPDYLVADWQHEVADGSTRLGYAEWVQHQEEDE